MSIQLKLDEAQEALASLNHPQAAAFEQALCAIGDAMGAALCEALQCARGETTQQGTAFAGICFAVRPVYSCQPMPEALEGFDGDGPEEWDEDAARLVTPFPWDGVTKWRALEPGDLVPGVRVRCSNMTLGIIEQVGEGRRAGAPLSSVMVAYDGGASGLWDAESLQTLERPPCRTCYEAIETTPGPCDECGAFEPDDDGDVRRPADYDAKRDGTALFHFGDAPSFPCHPLSTTWNGFDNVRVSPQVRGLIIREWDDGTPDGCEQCEALSTIAMDDDGLIDLSNGYATSLDD